MKKNNILFVAFLLQMISVISFAQKQMADLVVFNAKVYTVDSAFSTARAFAIADGKFVAVGSLREIRKDFGSDVFLDAQGRFIYPGFNDGHSHFLGYGLAQTKYAGLVGTKSFAGVIDILLAHQMQYPSAWVLGRGWDQNDWQDKSWPTKEELDKAFPDKPVVLTRIDGHAVLLNSQALRRAGITALTTSEGGEILLADGEPTGILIDNAIGLIRKVMPAFDKKDKTTALLRAQEDCFAAGLTTVTDAGLDKSEIALIESLQAGGQLNIRIYAMLNPTSENMNYYFPKGPLHTGTLTVSSVKLYADGALGSRGALLLEPYADDPGNSGMQLHPDAFYEAVCKQAYQAGFQVNTHAIGDSGNRLILRTYAKFLQGKNDRRWRIEHAQVVSPADLHYFKDYSIIPSVQATHCTSDMYWAGNRLGPGRIKTAYAYQHLLQQNGWLINGTDFPVEDIHPLKTFYAAVARMDESGWPEEGFQMEDALSREDALRSITIWPAMGSFDEKNRGSIEAGKFADFVILDKDLLSVPADKLPTVRIMATYLSGKQVFSAE
ncbi:MAG: amidohydrolase [Bacteroidales bacterium]|nr:amidohydrolase [Bacteroidales bacterium]